METKYLCLRENRGNPVILKEKGETQSYQSETEFQEQGDEEEIYGLIAPSAHLNENAILEEVNEAMKNALVEDGVNAKYISLTIHYKKQTGIPKEKGYRLPIEHRPNQPDFSEKMKRKVTSPGRQNCIINKKGRRKSFTRKKMQGLEKSAIRCKTFPKRKM